MYLVEREMLYFTNSQYHTNRLLSSMHYAAEPAQSRWFRFGRSKSRVTKAAIYRSGSLLLLIARHSASHYDLTLAATNWRASFIHSSNDRTCSGLAASASSF